MKLHNITLTFVLMLLMSSINAFGNKPGTFTTGKNTFLLNGEPFIVKAAELHYPRIPRPYWEHRIQMCKALGMNTVCLYVFWNIHEQQEGKFDFSGNNDVAEFCRLCQKNGMYVIVRPGPYVCAEWEMGGLPWWLLKKKDIRLREQDPYFMERVKIFEHEVGRQLAPLTIQNGGPIIMVQVENEYGSYGEDKAYVSAIRDIVRGSGFNKVTLFQCDWSSNFTKNGLDDLVWTMNFGTGSDIDQQFRRLGELRPDAPKMCSEFWSGWFDKWDARHETRPAKDMVEGIDKMLSKNISFSLYMTHGGTSFGHWAGANSPGFAPDVTSYDYDAPINEYGKPTTKYQQLRTTMQKYSKSKLPSIPKSPMPLIGIPEFTLTEFADIMKGGSISSTGPLKTFEDINMGWGSMAYTAYLPKTASPGILTINDAHDFAQIFINGKFIGTINRVKNEKSIALPILTEDRNELTILVEAMGRINFGRAIKDFKGITDDVTVTIDRTDFTTNITPKSWTCIGIPDSYVQAVKAFENHDPQYSVHYPQLNKIGYFRGYFNLNRVGDTFINMESFGKGQVYVNGHAIGRFWNIGPQQTLYLPGCWLKKGKNEVIVLDIVGPKGEPKAFCQNAPQLDKLNLEKNNKHNNPGDRPDLNSTTPAAKGSYAPGNGWQTVKFISPVKGRYLAITCLSSHTGNNEVAIAELYAQDNTGKRISREPWTTKYADSEDAASGNHTGDKIIDLQESTYWQTEKGADFPHLIVIDMGSVQQVSAVEYLPRAEQNAPNSVKDYIIYVY